MSRPAPRRPSRITTPKPRKIAGRDVAPADQTATPDQTTAASPTPAAKPPAAKSPAQPPTPPKTPKPAPPGGGAGGPDDPSGQPRAIASPFATRMLLGVVAVLALVLVLQGVWFAVHKDRTDDREAEARAAAAADKADDADDDAPITVPSDRPVELDQVAWLDGVEAAAAAAQMMFGRNWKNYDAGVDNAVTLMTERFAEEYRLTTDDVRDEFIRKKTQVEVRVVAQGVVRANDTELEALVFLNQYIFRGQGKDAKTSYTPYRALLTMVHTDGGWLVDGVDTE